MKSGVTYLFYRLTKDERNHPQKSQKDYPLCKSMLHIKNCLRPEPWTSVCIVGLEQSPLLLAESIAAFWSTHSSGAAGRNVQTAAMSLVPRTERILLNPKCIWIQANENFKRDPGAKENLIPEAQSLFNISWL